MENKKIFTVGMISLAIFIGIASYLWYHYFTEYENRLISEIEGSDYRFTRDVELVNSGGIDYINATNKDDESIIPVYYFRVKNNADKSYEYVLYFENATANDGCSPATMFSRDELEYELKLDNKVIKKGSLSEIKNNILDTNIVKSNSNNDYSLKVKLKETVTNYDDKHFHYVVTMKEKK